MEGQAKGMGLCFKEADGTRQPLKVLENRTCSLWKLGAMMNVQGRSQRRMMFNAQGIVRLE
jgi:hypothetical protein